VSVEVEVVVLDRGWRGRGGTIGDGVVLGELAHHLGGDSCDGFASALGALL